ncbi:MAG: hypothetical protein IPP15_01475 [Saprospiraceae bacterium]|uniref:Uncharacterized protein n=1 Tax=Candidatus Opimibacter skivensis TaxID=2982028 RepID=A0A9D7SQ95_9BACT|nr:hypothetical protein [Candidatus Opimibacter skivensis]
MIAIVLDETPKITNWIELIDIMYMLADFHVEKVTSMLHGFRDHEDYLVAYNATRALGLPTDDVVKKFRAQKTAVKPTAPSPPPPSPKRKWWQNLFDPK